MELFAAGEDEMEEAKRIIQEVYNVVTVLWLVMGTLITCIQYHLVEVIYLYVVHINTGNSLFSHSILFPFIPFYNCSTE